MVAQSHAEASKAWDKALAEHADLCVQAELTAKVHRFKDKIPKSTAAFPGPPNDTLMRTRDSVSGVCCFLCVCVRLFFFSFFFSFFVFLFR